MSSLNLTLAMMRASGSLPKNPCAKIDKLKAVEETAREKRVKVERSAKKQRSKAIQKLTKKVKQEIEEIDETYGKPGKPSKCSPAKKSSRKAKVADSPELRRGTKMEQKEHGHSKVDARQIAADHLAKDPHAYDPKPRAKPAKKATKKVATVKKAARAGQSAVEKFQQRVIEATQADVKKAKAEIKREVKQATKKAIDHEAKAAAKKAKAELAAAKKAAKKAAKAAAKQAAAAEKRLPKPKAPKMPKQPKQPRAARPDLPLPKAREEVFVADAPAANDAVDPKKDAAAMAGFEAMIARQMAKLQGGTVESMPASKKPRTGNTYVWDDDGSFSESDIEVLGDRAFTGARYAGQLAAEGSMFDTWKLRDGRNIAQTAFDAPRRAARTTERQP